MRYKYTHLIYKLMIKKVVMIKKKEVKIVKK